ncbi:MAG TPA: hypothetical protein VFK69_07610, partial [Candidatus Eisenbacteria bacterium]|nr:hypothetical protein [Candidatus Eisenbacteria bacterium]
MRHVTLKGLLVGAVVLVAAPGARAGCLETAFARVAHRLMATPAAADTLQFHRVTPESSVVIPPLPSGAPAPPATPTPRAVGFHPGDITKIGSDIHVAEDEVVEGDVVALGGSITVDGHVKGAVVSVGGDVSLSSTARVDGDVGSVGGELHEEPGDFVGGQRFTAARHRGGQLRSHIPIAALTLAERIVNFISNIIKQLILIALAWLVARFAAGRTAAAVETLRREPAASAGIGALVWALLIPSVIALALVMAILCITLIGIPLALAALVGYVAFFIVFPVWGLVVGAAAFGYRVAAQRGQPVPTLERAAVLGMVVVAAVSVAGALLRLIGFLPPVHGLGTFLHLVATAFSVVLATLGGGAWLRSEFATGAFGRWWAGRRSMP